LIAAGGGLLLFISLFLGWFGDFSAWEIFDLSDIVLALIALFAIAVGVSIFTGNPINVPGGAGGAVSVAGVLAFGMVATYVFEGEEKKFGLFLALIGTIGMVVGGMQLGRGSGTTGAPRTRAAEPTAPPPPPPPAGGTGV
jgi:hypothetical protein